MKILSLKTAMLFTFLFYISTFQRHYLTIPSIGLTNTSPLLDFFKNLITKHKSSIVKSLFANYHFKNYHFLAVVMLVLSFCSCKKGNFDSTVLENTTAGSASVRAATGGPSPNINYGAYIQGPRGTDVVNFQLNVAAQLGISCLRVPVIVPSKGTNLVPELNTGYKVLLNFEIRKTKGIIKPFRTDIIQYKKDLKNILNTFTVMPVVAVIENEESNRFFYSGTAIQYINQLKAAIGVMHARGIKVTNGAITRPGLELLVYRDFLTQGKKDSARMFKKQADVKTNDTAIQHRAAFIDTLLTNYATMNLDYVNFHWKDSTINTDPLNEVINYLQKRTGKIIFSNELGQFDTIPGTLIAIVQRCTDRGFPYIIWYSADESYNQPNYPLQNTDASLTPTGNAYRDYLKD